jgi:hypothetical protein
MAGDDDGDDSAVYAGEETNTVNKHLEGAAQWNGRTKEDEEGGRSLWRRRRSPWRQLPEDIDHTIRLTSVHIIASPKCHHRRPDDITAGGQRQDLIRRRYNVATKNKL